MVPGEATLTSVEGLIAAHEGNFGRAEQLVDTAVESKKTLLHTHHLWHNAAESRVLRLAEHKVRQNPLVVCYQRGSGLIAACFDSKDNHAKTYSAKRVLFPELSVFNPVRLVGVGTEAATQVGVIILVIALEPHHLRITLKR